MRTAQMGQFAFRIGATCHSDQQLETCSSNRMVSQESNESVDNEHRNNWAK